MQPIKGEKDAASLTEINFGRTDLMEFGRKKKKTQKNQAETELTGKTISIYFVFSQSC